MATQSDLNRWRIKLNEERNRLAVAIQTDDGRERLTAERNIAVREAWIAEAERDGVREATPAELLWQTRNIY
ncbi:hypothetical protein [Paraburkholderia fungorum]|uniref:hypothetical protein n=1 Tax=Paraburkholderia fungorum TaxID=134537 RepID=UPI002097BEF7|nr:hypothetical protein [Paraburkholderia fungorum]USX06833.1 hypothetical protein NHH62_18500 [Paraburkholderia fungorum]